MSAVLDRLFANENIIIMLHMLPLDLLSNKFQSYLNYLIHQTTPHRPPAPVQIPTVCVPPEMGAGVQ